MTEPTPPTPTGQGAQERDADLERLKIDYRLSDWAICDETFAHAIRLCSEARDERDSWQRTAEHNYASWTKERDHLRALLRSARAYIPREAELRAIIETYAHDHGFDRCDEDDLASDKCASGWNAAVCQKRCLARQMYALPRSGLVDHADLLAEIAGALGEGEC